MGAGTREAERLARQQEKTMEEQPTPLPWQIGEGGTHLYYIDDKYESGKTEDHNAYHDTVIVENGKEADIELIHKAVSNHAQLVKVVKETRRRLTLMLEEGTNYSREDVVAIVEDISEHELVAALTAAGEEV